MAEQQDNMKVISLHGTDDRLYELVARLVMSPDILRQNNNYPFKTTPQHTWYLCIENETVIGFMPVKSTSGGLYLDNYYICEDNRKILDSLISYIISTTDKPITVLSHKRHTDAFQYHGFIKCTIFAQYNKMQYIRKKGDVAK